MCLGIQIPKLFFVVVFLICAISSRQVFDKHCQKALVLKKKAKSTDLASDWEKAIEEFSLCISSEPLKPLLSKSYYHRGICHFHVNRYEDSLRDIDESILIEPKFGGAYFYRGQNFRMLDRYEEADEEFTKAVEINPEHDQAYFHRAVVRVFLKQLEESIEDLTKSIEIDSKHENIADAYHLRAQCLHELGRVEDSIRDYSLSLFLRPDDENIIFSRGKANFQVGEYKKSVRDCTKAIEISPKHSEYYHYRGRAHFQLNDHEKAVEDLEKAFKLDPQDLSSLKLRSVSLHHLEFFEDAMDGIREYLRLGGEETDDLEIFREMLEDDMKKDALLREPLEIFLRSIKLGKLWPDFEKEGVMTLEEIENYSKEELEKDFVFLRAVEARRIVKELGRIAWEKKSLIQKIWSYCNRYILGIPAATATAGTIFNFLWKKIFPKKEEEEEEKVRGRKKKKKT